MDDLECIEDPTLPHIRLRNTTIDMANSVRNRLRKQGISFEPSTPKAELQALCSLSELQIIHNRTHDIRELVPQVTAWWRMNASTQVKELKKRGLDTTGTKVDHIKALILKIPAVQAEKAKSRNGVYQAPDDSDEDESEDLEKTSEKNSEEDEDEEVDSAIENDEDEDSSEEFEDDSTESSSDGSDEDVEEEDFDLGDD